MNKKHTMPSRLIELEHELASTLRKVDEQSELLRLSQEENEEKRKDVVWLATEKAKLENYVKRLEEAGDALYENSDPTKWDLPEANARKLKEQQAWLKAREGKP